MLQSPTTAFFFPLRPAVLRGRTVVVSSLTRHQRLHSFATMNCGTVGENLARVRHRVKEVAKGLEPPPRLVAVSKTKPVAALKEAYDAGQRHFGENYSHEVLEKAPELPDDVKWHFIGHLQSNKAKALVEQVPNLWMVEAVDSIKLADRLQAATAGVLETRRKGERLKILVQIDTSGEATKSGKRTEDAAVIAQHVTAQCPALQFAGVMTIGASGDMTCFDKLVDAREAIARATGLDAASLELSMGMSNDFEEAIARGSTNIRVGSSIFGERQYRSKEDPPVAEYKEGESKSK